MNSILKAKHWQLFLLYYGLPLVGQAIVLFISRNINFNNNFEMAKFTLLSFFNMLIPVIIFLYWLLSTGIKINNSLSRYLRIDAKKFTISFLLIILLIILISLFIINSMLSSFFSSFNKNNEVFILATFSLTILIFTSLVYCCSFVAKVLNIYEFKRNVKFNDFKIDFLLIFFLFPIGIWYIQPKINNLLIKESVSD